MSLYKIAYAALALLLICMLAAPAAASSVVPTLMPGNPTCADLGYVDDSYKFDPPVSGTSPDGINIDVAPDGIYFDWSAGANIQVQAVIVKASNAANTYVYPVVVWSDTWLHAPVNPSGSYPALSHIEFCYSQVQTTPPTTAVPEFPTISLPMMLIVGLLGVIVVLKS